MLFVIAPIIIAIIFIVTIAGLIKGAAKQSKLNKLFDEALNNPQAFRCNQDDFLQRMQHEDAMRMHNQAHNNAVNMHNIMHNQAMQNHIDTFHMHHHM